MNIFLKYKPLVESIFAKVGKLHDQKRAIESAVEDMKDTHSAEALYALKYWSAVFGTIGSIGSVWSTLSFFNFQITGSAEIIQWSVGLSLIGAIFIEATKQSCLKQAFKTYMTGGVSRPAFSRNFLTGILALAISVWVSYQGVQLAFDLLNHQTDSKIFAIKDIINVDSIYKFHDNKIFSLNQDYQLLSEQAMNLSKNWNPNAKDKNKQAAHIQEEISKEEIRKNAAVREAKAKNDAYKRNINRFQIQQNDKTRQYVWWFTALCEVLALFQIFMEKDYNYNVAKDQISLQPELEESLKQVQLIKIDGNLTDSELKKQIQALTAPFVKEIENLQNQVKAGQVRNNELANQINFIASINKDYKLSAQDIDFEKKTT